MGDSRKKEWNVFTKHVLYKWELNPYATTTANVELLVISTH